MALAAPPASLVFTTTRRNQQLISPSKPTPKELKELSDIDDQAGLRFYNPVILFYGNNPAMEGRDPVKVIREALAEALVHFYPLAGRLREGPGRKLTVDCTGDGVLFIEADAHDVTLEQFDHPLHPPFPCLDQLFCSALSPEEFFNSPLLLFQVTRLKCGGFIFAIQMNHSICDGAGLAQFMAAIGEMARGAHAPSVPPVWQRDLLNARNPPRITCNHHEQDPTTHTKDTFVLQQNIVQHSFFFSPTNVSTLRRLLPLHLRRTCSTFELITACMWRCRTIALQFDPNEEVCLGIVVDARAKYDPPLPFGYYGNAIVTSAVKTIARKLCENSLGYALELVRKAKNEVTHEYMKSLADLIVLRDRQPEFRPPNAYQVSDLTRARFEEADFGWGKAAYGGPAVGGTPWITSYYTAYKDNNRKNIGFVVPICLPSAAMKRFIQELEVMLEDRRRVVFISSSL